MSRFLSSLRCTPVLAAGAILLATTGARAGTLDFTAYGWTATFDDNIDLTVLSAANGGVVLSLEKFADFTEGPTSSGVIQPLNIVFHQTSASAVKTIAIEDESIFNDTGVSWSGFKFSLLSDGKATTFDTSASAGFSTNPFPTQTYSSSDTVLTVSGGSLASGGFPNNLWQPGYANGALFINTGGSTSFVFAEQPVTGGGTTPPPVIPLPASAYTTIAGLVAVAGYKLTRKRASI